ncbi:MAG: hypothetical protein J5833_05975 [Victivallales bacterium]|nr:hypothetical protein [Victivallales bacterium]
MDLRDKAQDCLDVMSCVSVFDALAAAVVGNGAIVLQQSPPQLFRLWRLAKPYCAITLKSRASYGVGF